MNSKNSYDVLVIGVGMAGVSVAHKAARSGKRVAVVDSRPYGGTCALRGCDPKKVLVGAAELIEWSRRMSGSGVEGELTIDWPALMKHKESIIRDTPGSLEQSMSKLGVETLHGAARFTGRNRVIVNDREVDAEHIVIAVGPKLTPVAVHEGMIAVSNILKGNRKHPDYRGTPSVAFTVPSLARAGLLEEEARAAGYDVEVKSGDMGGWYTLRRTNESHGAYKVVIDKTSGTILGAHILGGHAGETINIFASAIRNGISAVDLKTGIYVHPAATSDVAYML